MQTFARDYIRRYTGDEVIDISDVVATANVELIFVVDDSNPDTILIEQVCSEGHGVRALYKRIPTDIIFYPKDKLKSMAKPDPIARVMFRDLFDGVIDELRITIGVSAQWPMSVDDALKRLKRKGASFLMTGKERIAILREACPSGPIVVARPTMVSSLKDGQYHHPHYPAHIHASATAGWMAYSRFSYKEPTFKNAWQPYGRETLMAWTVQYCQNGVSTLNKSGVPSFFSVQLSTMFDTFAPLYAHRPERSQELLQRFAKMPTFEAKYYYDDVIVPDEILETLRFPLDDFEEFDLMMRL